VSVADIYKWKAVEDSKPPSELQEYTTTGLVGFDFEKFSEQTISTNSVGYNNPFQDLIKELWPGNLRQQLAQMNEFIDRENVKKRTKNKTKNVTKYKFWQFIGILLSTSLFSKGEGSLGEAKE
jgi:hypothetical protein